MKKLSFMMEPLLVEKMDEKGWNVGICTNKPEDLAEALLSKMSPKII